MGLAAGFVESATGQLDAVAQSGFTAVANAINSTAAAAATLALIVIGLNIIVQYRPMPLGAILWTMAKLTLLVAVGLQWSGFSPIVTAVQGGMDTMAGALLGQFGGAVTGSASGADAGGITLAEAIDKFISDFAAKANSSMEGMSWFAGSIMSAIITMLMAIVGGAAALIIVFAQVIITVYLAVAPIFIACWIFESTKDYFTRWLQATLSYMLYPVVVAAVLGGMIRIISGYIDTLGTDVSSSISDFVPFIACMLIMATSVLFIPTIVNSLSGMITSVSPFAGAVAGAAMGTLAMRGGAMAAGKAREVAPLVAAGAKQQVQNVAGAMNRAENFAGKMWARNRKY